MNAFDDKLRLRAADKAQALGEIATLLATIDGQGREPGAWERLCLLRAFSLVSAGCYLLAGFEVQEAASDPARVFDMEPGSVLAACTLFTLFQALQEAMGEEARAYPHLGPIALG